MRERARERERERERKTDNNKKKKEVAGASWEGFMLNYGPKQSVVEVVHAVALAVSRAAEMPNLAVTSSMQLQAGP